MLPKPEETQIEEHANIIEFVPEKEKYTTYLPLYTAKAACGYFGDGELVEESGWIRSKGVGKLNRNMFVVQAVGHSMEPRINDGDYCVFRVNPGGSRQGKIMLVQHRNFYDDDYAGAYSIKEYSSVKSYDEFGNWQHERVELKPFNKDFDSIIITPEDGEEFRVIGEFLGVIK
jgi:phage repressor protein C with HTH and peptisase S24 domain